MMTSHVPLLFGIVVGLSIAVPVGPMSLLCIQRTLTFGMRVGVCTGLGAVTVNVLYGALILVGLDWAGTLLAHGGRVLSLAGGLFLLRAAARTFRQQRGFGPMQADPLLPSAAYGSAVAFNAANPLAPALMMALLSPAVAVDTASLKGSVLLLLGMGLAAVAWWVCLAGTVSLLRSRLTLGMLAVVNKLAAGLLTFYAAIALARFAGL